MARIPQLSGMQRDARRDAAEVSSVRSLPTSSDKIYDFVAAFDTIALENAIFTAFAAAANNAAISAASFWTGSVAHDDTDRIIYNRSSGALIYESNGNAAGGAGKFATLVPKLILTFEDFVVL